MLGVGTGGWTNMEVVEEICHVCLEELPQWAQWLALRAGSCTVLCNPVLSLLTGGIWAETACSGAQGTTGHTSTVRGTELPIYAKQRKKETHRKDGPERYKLPQERSAKRTWGQMWHKAFRWMWRERCWFLNPQARCTCWVAPNASHMQDAYQDRSLPRSPLASTLPLLPTGKTYLVWVLRVLFLREKKKGGPYLFIPEIKSLQEWDLELPGKGDMIGAQGRGEFPGGGKEGSGVTKPICSCPSPC